MEFFNKIKIKLKVRNLISAIVFFAFTSLFASIGILSLNFSSYFDVRIPIVDIDILIPYWVVSFLLILISIIPLWIMCPYLKSFFTNTEFNEMIQKVKEIGDAEGIGTMLSSISKSPYAKGDLRFNEKIIFYMISTKITIVPAVNIRNIQAEIRQTEDSQETYIAVYHQNGKSEIITKEKKVFPLLEEMKRTFSTVS